MVSLLAVSLVAALPTLRPLQPPLALFTPEVMQDANTASPQNGDQFIAFGGPACAGKSVPIDAEGLEALVQATFQLPED